MSIKPKIVVIAGPTASGKTALGIRIARAFGGEVVSADSRQIYRGMDIGTGKPTPAEMEDVPHHLIDIRDPDEGYTAADYQRDAIAATLDILARGKLPILVGGTGLYIKSVVENLDIPSVVADPELRMTIEREIAEEGLPAVFEKLIALDPDAEREVDGRNPRRVVRALEVARATGLPFTAARKKQAPLFEALEIGLDPPAAVLRDRIERRVDEIFRDDALPNEVRTLVARYGADAPALDAIGYRETITYLNGRITNEEAAELIKRKTRAYAKRQMTWFKKDAAILWAADPEEAETRIRVFLK